MMRILSVCTGNICRSPTAEGVFKHLKQNWHVDSCGIADYHIGEAPDSRAITVAAERGVNIADLRARQICNDDFYQYDLILAMDDGHLRYLQSMHPTHSTAEIHLHMAQCQATHNVPDPYYGDMQDFRSAYDLILAGAQEWIRFYHGRS